MIVGLSKSLLVVLICSIGLPSAAPPGQQEMPVAAPVEQLGDNLYRLGAIRVDTAARTLTVPGRVNQVALGGPLEFLANTKSLEPGEEGFRAYESALELETNAITFNTALLLLDLDAPERDLASEEPYVPEGDPVEIWVEWDAGGERRKVRAEELLFDYDTGTTMPPNPWVYTGSLFVQDFYVAEAEGVLIGFIHRSAPVIERPLVDGVGEWGHIQFNQELKLTPGTPVTLTVVAIEN